MFLLLFFECDDSYPCVSLAEFGQMEFGDVFDTAQVIVDAFSQRAGSLAVDDAHAGQMSQVGVIQIFIQLSYSFVYCFAQQIDFNPHGGGFGHFHFSGAGSGHGREGR